MTFVPRTTSTGEDLVSPISCLPWWRTQFTDPSLKRKIDSGVGRDAEGNINADPERLRAAAERQLGRGHLPLAAYTLGRYAQSEVGSGTPEEMMAVIQAAINRSRLEYPQLSIEDGVNRLLLRRTCKATTKYPLASGACGRYGPIHASDTLCTQLGLEKGCAPYGRWAATSKDPTVQTLLIASFALAGQAGRFARGADDQFGPDALRWIWRKRAAAAQAKLADSATQLDASKRAELEQKARLADSAVQDARLREAIQRRAKAGNYWIGPLAGINPRHTLLFAYRPDITGTPVARDMINAAVIAVTSPKPAVPTTVCPRPGTERSPLVASRRAPVAAASAAGVMLFLALSAGVGLWTATRAEKGKLFPWY